ncbi:S1 RNA-binding domain-containing protein [Streptococcus sp. H31]|uniref:CvfB family protein n=1 Tax=Streptococcus huangxiaojuni TaxID=3237239 RepID=UPI0034A1DF2E
MNQLLATVVTGLVTDENEQFYFIQKDGITFALAKEEGEHQLGDMVKGFVYTDMKQKQRMTTKEVQTTRSHYGWGEVTEVRRDLGVFLEVGLPDKQVVVSLDLLPDLKTLWPKKGDKLYVSLSVDRKNRIWAVPAAPEVFQKMAGPAYNNMQNQTWPAIVYRLKLSGTFVYLPENNMLGFIHPSERYNEPRLGEVLNARVIGFRDADRTLYLSLKPRSFETLEQDGQMILAYLQANGGFMTLNDKSSPDEIKAVFGLSKGQFKKALGRLMKAGQIKQDKTGTELVKEASPDKK